MAINIYGSATSRDTEIGGLLESFIDNNTEDLSANMINALEDLAGEVDDAAKEQEERIAELESRVAQLEDQVQDLENELLKGQE